MRGPRDASWLVDSAADVHVCNDRSLMTEYYERPTRIGGSTADGMSPGRGKVRLRLSLKDGREGVVLNLKDVFLLPHSPSNSAAHLTQIDDDTYEWPVHAYRTTTSPRLPLTVWHQRLCHLNFPSLKQHLRKLEIDYLDDSEKHVCDSCQRAKATKIYNRHEPQKRATTAYQFVHTDLVGPINPVGFGGERYFFTFTDNLTRYTEIQTGAQKSD